MNLVAPRRRRRHGVIPTSRCGVVELFKVSFDVYLLLGRFMEFVAVSCLQPTCPLPAGLANCHLWARVLAVVLLKYVLFGVFVE